MARLIAVTGATGSVGGRVARLLAERGVPQRLVVREAARAPRLAGAEVRQIPGYGAGAEVREALDGVDTLFLVPAQESADRVEQHLTAVDAAAAAGVRRIVYLSFVDARPDATFTLARQHWATEERIRASGVAWTFPRMNFYLDFLPSLVSAEGVIEGPAGDGRAAMVTRADVADVTAATADRRRARRAHVRHHRSGGADPRRGGRADVEPVRPADRLPGPDGRGGVRVPRLLRRSALAGRGMGDHLPGYRRR